jgi:predicted ester cyclase
MMKNIQNTFVYRWFDQVWNRGNASAIDELMDPQAVAHGLPVSKELKGPDAFKPFHKAFQAEFPSIHITVEDVVTDGDDANYTQVARCSVKGTHKSGKPVEFSGVSICKVKDGRLLEGWNNFDFLDMNMQLGKISAEQIS